MATKFGVNMRVVLNISRTVEAESEGDAEEKVAKDFEGGCALPLVLQLLAGNTVIKDSSKPLEITVAEMEATDTYESE